MIMGIDVGSSRLGYCIGDEEVIKEYGLIENKEKNEKIKMFKIYEFLHKKIKERGIKKIAGERIFVTKNQKTAFEIIQVWGLINLLAYEFDIEVYYYTPTQIKKEITGKGKASKKEIMEVIRRTEKIESKIDDVFDAVAIYKTLLRRGR